MPDNKKIWLILDRAGRVWQHNFDSLTSYQKVLETIGSRIRDQGFDDGLPNVLFLNGKIVIKKDLYEVASNYQTAFDQAWINAREKVNATFVMPEPVDL